MDTLKFLIVEDDYRIARELRTKIMNIGYSVTAIASSSMDAITSFNEHKPDFVIMDIELPERNDAGIQLTENFRSRDENLMIIYFTNHIAESELMQKAIDTLPDGILSKDANINQLLVNINNCVRRKTHHLEGLQIRRDGQSFWIKTTNKIYKRIFFDNICWFQSEDKMTKIFVEDRAAPIVFSSTMTHLVERQLNVDFFVRTHLSYMINISKAFDLNRGDRTIMVKREIEQGGAVAIPISNTYFQNLMTRLNIITTR